MRGDPSAKIDKLGNGTPGLVGMLGGPSRPMTPGASPYKLKRRLLGGAVAAAPLAAYRSMPEVLVPVTYTPPDPNGAGSGIDSGPGDGGSDGDGDGDGDGGSSSVG